MQCLILKVSDLAHRGFAKAKHEADPFFAVGRSTSLNQHIIINVSRTNNAISSHDSEIQFPPLSRERTNFLCATFF